MTVAKRYQWKEYGDSMEEVDETKETKQGIIIQGTEYRVGDYLVTGICNDYGQPIFGKVQRVELIDCSYHFVCLVLDSIFNTHYHAFEILHQTDIIVRIAHNHLPYHLPASAVLTDNGLNFLCVRHSIIC